MVQENTFIDSIDAVKETLPFSKGNSWRDWEIRKVMREELGMRYKKVIPVAIHANS